MAETEFISPWASPPPAPPAPPASPPASQLIWAVASSLLFALLLWWQVGWMWALAGVVGVFVHEYGHVLAINAAGSGPGRIHFIPLLGGAATMARPPQSQFKSVLIALAGPSFGLLATVPFFGMTLFTGDRAWLQGAFFIAAINLLNLVPAPPLDGAKALGPSLAWVHPLLERGIVFAVGLLAVLWAASRQDWIIALFIGIAALGGLRRPPMGRDLPPLSRSQWAISILCYLSALALCVLVLEQAAHGLGHNDPLKALSRFGV
ncbi:MAG: metalloprotease [Caulobacterales bacterium]